LLHASLRRNRVKVGALKPRRESADMRSIMDLSPYALTALIGVGLSFVTFAVCHLWHARRMRALLVRLEKVDRARQAAGQQAQQARKQVEQLQKDLAAQHKARADALSAQRRVQEVKRPAPELPASLLDIDAGPAMAAHGFADTMPLLDGPGEAR
jgi:hypothetical protein